MFDPSKPAPGSTWAASPWVERFIDLVPAGGDVLDVACGGGRHLAFGQVKGYRMCGVDRDLSGIDRRGPGATFELVEANFEDGSPWPFAGRRFAGVLVTNYLWRPLLPAIVSAVAADGVLIYETFGVGNDRLGRPRNPEFLLRPGELIDLVRTDFTIVAYENVRLAAPDRIVQRIAAVGRCHPLGLELAAPA